MVVFFRLNNTN